MCTITLNDRNKVSMFHMLRQFGKENFVVHPMDAKGGNNCVILTCQRGGFRISFDPFKIARISKFEGFPEGNHVS